MDSNIKRTLLKSPMFQLSLGSKELFHSNFLFWIWQVSPEMFRYLIQQLFEKSGCPVDFSEWGERFEVKRESNNYDLCVLADNSVKLVIENKVKSIPNKEQLDGYWNETTNAKHLLLSLSTNFPHLCEIKKEQKWIVTNYEIFNIVLSECVRNSCWSLTPYQSYIISDYADMIRCLHQIQESWHEINTFVTPETERLYDLRINDLQEKHRFSNLCAKVRSRFIKEFAIEPIMNSSREEIFKKTYRPQDGNIFLGWGMTRAQGLLEAKIIVEDNVVLLIQIQGNQYRHCIELNNHNSAEKNWEFYSNYPLTAWFISTSNFNKPFHPFKSSPEPLDIRPDTTRKKPYNQYGNQFLYKSIIIPNETTVEDVIEMLIYDCKSILNNINRN